MVVWKVAVETILAAVAVNIGNTYISVKSLPRYREFMSHDLQAIRLLLEILERDRQCIASDVAFTTLGPKYCLNANRDIVTKEWKKVETASLIFSPVLIGITFLLGSPYPWFTFAGLTVGACFGVPKSWKEKVRESVFYSVSVIWIWNASDLQECKSFCEGEGAKEFGSIHFVVVNT